jgi:hypothetical protein
MLHVTAADTKFIGSGPVGTTLTPTDGPIVVQQGTWFGCMGTCHDATGTTMHNSYDAATRRPPDDHVTRLADARQPPDGHTGNFVGHQRHRLGHHRDEPARSAAS